MKKLPPIDPATNAIYLTLEEAYELRAGQVPPGVEVRIRDPRVEGTPLYGDQPDFDEDDERIFDEMVAESEAKERQRQARQSKARKKR